jgi:ADP-ribose pyrophosphatase YjhB (NUDIX family)
MALAARLYGRTLLIQCRGNHHWEPPGGVLELAEGIHDGLRREVREETGLDIEPVILTGVYKDLTRGIVALVFRCKVTGGHLTTNEEVAGFRWACKSGIEHLMTEVYAIRVLDAYSQIPLLQCVIMTVYTFSLNQRTACNTGQTSYSLTIQRN